MKKLILSLVVVLTASSTLLNATPKEINLPSDESECSELICNKADAINIFMQQL